jgi:hypothetical protein
MTRNWLNEKETVMKYLNEDYLTLQQIGTIYGVGRERIRAVIRNVYGMKGFSIKGRVKLRKWKRLQSINSQVNSINYWKELSKTKPSNGNSFITANEYCSLSGLSIKDLYWVFSELSFKVTLSPIERLNNLIEVDPITGCWNFTGCLYPTGYGHIQCAEYNEEYAHRLAWMIANKQTSIPEGKMICHTCNSPSCCNSEHLYLGDAKTNAQDRERNPLTKSTRRPNCPVQVIKEGVVIGTFKTQMEAAKFLDVNASLLPAYFAGRVKSIRGYQLEKI